MNINPNIDQKIPALNRLFTGTVRKSKSGRMAHGVENDIKKRRIKNKLARKARRKNRIISLNLHHKFKN